jgi:DNA-binding MarR family transcriptional regulator
MTDRSDALLGLEREIGVLLRRVRRVIGERAREVHPDLQPSTYLMLGHVSEHGPLRASTMCAVFDIDKGAISRQVQHLLDLGLVDRAPDPADGRATLISISAEGARRLADVADHRRKWWDERLADWTVEDLAGFVRTLARYNASLGSPPDRG